MCIDMGIDSRRLVTMARCVLSFMIRPYKTKPAAGWPRSAGAGRFDCDWVYRSIARTTPTRMPIPMGIGIDIVAARSVNIALQDDRDLAGMSIEKQRKTAARRARPGGSPLPTGPRTGPGDDDASQARPGMVTRVYRFGRALIPMIAPSISV